MTANSAAAPRVLVTRPAGEANEALCDAVKAAGYAVYSQPLMVLQGLAQIPVAQRQMLQNLDRYEHIIFISSNAVHFGMTLIEDCWPQVPVGLNWYAIGTATAAKLARYGIAAITPGSAMTSESLLACIELQNVRDQRVLIVKGEGGRETLGRELTQRGALVEELACYRREPPDVAAGAMAAQLSAWDINVILISSGEGLANFDLLLSPAETTNFKHIGLIVPSERVAKMAHDAGFDQVVTAENASDEAMLRSLEAWRADTGE